MLTRVRIGSSSGLPMTLVEVELDEDETASEPAAGDEGRLFMLEFISIFILQNSC